MYHINLAPQVVASERGITVIKFFWKVLVKSLRPETCWLCIQCWVTENRQYKCKFTFMCGSLLSGATLLLITHRPLFPRLSAKVKGKVNQL
ncbi:MAG: hypothetical protein ACTSRS_09400 [Candidatus Helarchaeota archaeon]